MSMHMWKHPAYIELVAAGPDIIPFALKRLADTIGHDIGDTHDATNSPWLLLTLLGELTDGACMKNFPTKHAGKLDCVRDWVLKWGESASNSSSGA